MQPSRPVYLNQIGIISALGVGLDETRSTLFSNQPSRVLPGTYRLSRRDETSVWVGAAAHAPLPRIADVRHASRNNRLLAVALEQIADAVERACQRFSAARVALVLGTSTSGIDESLQHHLARATGTADREVYHFQQQLLGSTSTWASGYLGIAGPSYSISTACSSSAKALAAAARLLRAGLADAVVAGGVDTLSRFTLEGFDALDSLAKTRCNPMSVNRDGINIGEGAAVFLMSLEEGGIQLSGWGESSDAHHISAPAPDGRGARQAIAAALERAGLSGSEIDYVNLHGTATQQNDLVEANAVADLIGTRVWCSSTKALTGHTLGAAGAIEAAICAIALADKCRLPPHLWDGERDPALPPLMLAGVDARASSLRHALSNSFAFGGSNAALIFSHV